MQFLVHLLRVLHQDENATVSDAANAAYEKVLQPYHGWITSGVFWAALKLVPSREALYANLGNSSSLREDMGSFVTQFDQVLSKLHSYMVSKASGRPPRGWLRASLRLNRPPADHRLIGFHVFRWCIAG